MSNADTHTSTSSTTAGAGAPRKIPRPTGHRAPLKSNVFDRAAGASSQLLPMFPYHDAGAMVPCVSIFTGDPEDGDFGHFFHWNTVDEITVVFGANGAMLQSAQIFANQELHGVNSFLRTPTDPDAFGVMTITQRQSDDEKQREAIIFRCQKCHEQLLRFEYDSTPKGIDGYSPEQWGGSVDDEYLLLSTLWGGAAAAARMNDDAIRTCGKCGHANDKFPQPKWGWQRCVEQTHTTNRSKVALDAAIRALSEKKAV